MSFPNGTVAPRPANFSRPLPSPSPNMKPTNVETPTKTPRLGGRPALGELSLSASCLNPRESIATPLTGYGRNPNTANRLIDFTKNTSPPPQRSPSVPPNPNYPRSRHTRRLSKVPRNTPGHRVTLSLDTGTTDTDSTITELHADLGGRARPIMHFRPNIWRHLERDRQNLNLDLFWPIKTNNRSGSALEERDEDVFPVEELRPLCDFRHLRSLQLNGMLQSYQKYIWVACWVNPWLEELTLEMALEPAVDPRYQALWPIIEGDWNLRTEGDCSSTYLGCQGEGVLSGEFGSGEYLDSRAIAMAKMAASRLGGNLRHLPVVKLVLSGFVVDAGPFLCWFDPMRLRRIEFNYCVDAGFAIAGNMYDSVEISYPEAPLETSKMVKISKHSRADLHVVTLTKGKKVHEPATRLKPKISAILSHKWFSTHATRQDQEGNQNSAEEVRHPKRKVGDQAFE